ncbi:RNA polymerase sigma-70 factor [Hymenobacter sp. BT186]|uniref:RNA polymerase sigma-70 factor n=1 Tax=Hymenobacter telluris TaxID=2816474 RepID=A0A939ETQ6_9BACT|nr:RNA polymerase sigma-70 factor [Hymenobacter telluris]MBO0357106.1 RNA polymerase sigma-70 factor [Hymenobacter telluris]MBW3373133.1 RNA polymerase sigma-70 factor [Hymenobacter norwichensis]
MKLTSNALEKSASARQPDSCQLFKHLFQLHAPGIYRLAYTHLHSRAEAQEIVQECFLKFWEKRREVSSDAAAIKGYLYTSAYHAILNQVRRQHNWVYQDYPPHLTVEQEPPTAELEYQELTLCYTHAVAQLPTKRREIFSMSRQEGLSNATIAQKLNISIKTVEAQITQSLKFLRTCFQAHGATVTLLLLVLQ